MAHAQALGYPLASRQEVPLARWALIGLAAAFLGLFLVLPLVAVFVEALRKGWARRRQGQTT